VKNTESDDGSFLVVVRLPLVIVAVFGKFDMYFEPGKSDPSMWVAFSTIPGFNLVTSTFLVVGLAWSLLYKAIVWVPERKK
jgi:hypothetical protein